MRVEAVVVTGRPTGRMIGIATPRNTSKKSQRRSSESSLSEMDATLLPSPEAQVPALDAEDHADRHRGGPEGRADDDSGLRGPVRRVHDPLRELAQRLAG